MLARVKKTLCAVVAAWTMAVALAGCGSSADEPEVSGAGSASVVAHGVIEKDGEPVSGAQVRLTLWPEDDDTPEGGTVDTRVEDAVTTDDDGRFVASLDPAELPSRYFNGDYLNFDLDVWNDTKLGHWSSTVHLVEQRFWRQDEQERVADDALSVDFDLGKNPTVTVKTLDGPDEKKLFVQ